MEMTEKQIINEFKRQVRLCRGIGRKEMLLIIDEDDHVGLDKLHKANVSNSLHHPIKFGRWLLKNAKEHWEDGLLCWSYEGKSYNTEELFKIFCVQQ